MAWPDETRFISIRQNRLKRRLRLPGNWEPCEKVRDIGARLETYNKKRRTALNDKEMLEF